MKRQSVICHSSLAPECKMKSVFAAAATDDTLIMNLNDDCLLEVFGHLSLIDLCSVADVCTRFRRTAQACFAYSKKTDLNVPEDILNRDGHRQITANHVLLRTSKVLRNFGVYIATFKELSDSDYTGNSRHILWPGVSRRNYSYRILEMLAMHCSEDLKKLEFSRLDLTDELPPLLRPMLEQLDRLKLCSCTFSDSVSKILPKWCSQLQELHIHFIKAPIHDWYQPFPKLLKITFMNLGYLTNHDIEEILKCNSQLKNIKFNDCPNINTDILQSIAKYVPGVETLTVRLHGRTKMNLKNVKCFSHLNKLQSLTLDFPARSSKFIVSALCVMGTAEIPLKEICVKYLKLNRNVEQFVNEISKLKQLRTLNLYSIQGLEDCHITAICNQLGNFTINRPYINRFPPVENIWLLERKSEMPWVRSNVHSNNGKCAHFVKW